MTSLWGAPAVVMERIAGKDLTLSDGTRIPKGTTVAAAAHQLQRDTAALENAGAFDPFRYARIMHSAAAEEDDAALKLQATTTSMEYLPFGHGPYAWCVLCYSVLLLRDLDADMRMNHGIDAMLALAARGRTSRHTSSRRPWRTSSSSTT